MKLIIGLGNPGEQYEKTRHNTGFRAVDVLVDNSDWKMNDKFNAEIAEAKIGKAKALLSKPQTLMNKSGQAVGKIARYYKVKKEDILIIYDDIDLVVGTLRLRPSGSSGGHQGMQSTLSALKTENVARLKIGIAEKKGGKQKLASEEYVLKPPSKAGEEALKKSLKLVPEIIEQWIDGETNTTVNV